MSIKTNELTQFNSFSETDTVLVDSSQGTGRIPFSVLNYSTEQSMKDIFLSGGVPYGKELPYSWSELATRVKAGNFEGIHISDYKTITLTTGEVVIMEVAGIDTYYKCGDSTIGHHIDFISRDCLRGARVFNSTDTNNGTEAEPNPWRASELFAALNNTTDGVITTLPSDLQNVIIEKRALLETRYSASGALTEPTGWAWNNSGKLWLPTEAEVWGRSVWSSATWGNGGGGQNIQYPIFMGGAKHIIKGDGNGGGRCAWWESSVRTGSSTYVCSVGHGGVAGGHVASDATVRVPLCFRIG